MRELFVFLYFETLKMEVDDIIYLCLLIFTIVFGYFFKRLNEGDIKKWISTIIGLGIVTFVSGIHVFHSLFCTLVNSLIILYTSKSICHTCSFFFSFLYLIFFRSTVYFGIPYPPAHTNLVQMVLTLKLVGLAFEVHDSYAALEKKGNSNRKDEIKEVLNEEAKNKEVIVLDFEDIFHYAFCYIGVLTGPYYSYKTFSDYFKFDFYKYALCKETTIGKLILVPLYALVFLIVSHYYPVQYATTDEFYSQTTFWYRLWYMTPVFVSFRMRIYVGLLLSEAACTVAGLGAYPTITQPKPGKGPSCNFDLLEALKKEPPLRKEVYYNFETVHNIDTWYTETDPSVRSSIRYWNMCVQYWMAFIVYKRFPIKALRTTATFVVSALWHGIYAGYYLCLCSVPFYLPIEDIWESLLRKEAVGIIRQILNVLFWIVRTQAFTYMGMAFSLLSMKNGLRYYESIYYIYHFTSIIGLVLGIFLTNFVKKKEKAEKLKEKS